MCNDLNKSDYHSPENKQYRAGHDFFHNGRHNKNIILIAALKITHFFPMEINQNNASLKNSNEIQI